jgi:hypothetical protein
MTVWNETMRRATAIVADSLPAFRSQNTTFAPKDEPLRP